jgi:hypothetical protein
LEKPTPLYSKPRSSTQSHALKVDCQEANA